MRLGDFEAMVRRMAAEFPDEFLEGIAEIAVSPRALEHPDRPGIYTLGECVPLPAAGHGPEAVQSRVVLYYGSFAAVARDHASFDWREEAWETLTHEVRHHVEWRAEAPDLEALDRAAEQNYARHDGERFDPLFYRDGESVGPGLFRVEDDYFMEVAPPGPGGTLPFRWAGEPYRVAVPAGLRGPAFLSVEGLRDPPPGELVLVIAGRAGWRQLWRPAPVTTVGVRAETE